MARVKNGVREHEGLTYTLFEERENEEVGLHVKGKKRKKGAMKGSEKAVVFVGRENPRLLRGCCCSLSSQPFIVLYTPPFQLQSSHIHYTRHRPRVGHPVRHRGNLLENSTGDSYFDVIGTRGVRCVEKRTHIRLAKRN